MSQLEAAVTPKRPHPDSELTSPSAHRRLDIQGLRALAVISVVLYHANLLGISGGFIGVDFFFVLSGFLITHLLLREIQEKGKIALGAFWGARARRLMPAATIVTLATTVAAGQLLPYGERRSAGTDALYSILFSANWRFAQQETNYLASGPSPSPFLHFWSLGVEEQFYLVWPLLLSGLALIYFRTKRSGVFVLAFAVILGFSLAFCVQLTTDNQPYAFFGSPARAWQLVAGGLVAAFLTRLSVLQDRLKLCLGLVGLALMTISVFVLREDSQTLGLIYPSWLALAPTVAAVMLIVSGVETSHGLTRFLSVKPLTLIGDASYSLYLWHWPLLVLGPLYLGSNNLSTRLFLVGLATSLAFLTYRFVENPVRRASALKSSNLLSLLMGVLLLALSAYPAINLAQYMPSANVKIVIADETAKPKPPSVTDSRYFSSKNTISASKSLDTILLSKLQSDFTALPPYYDTCQRTFSDDSPFVTPGLSKCSFGAKDYTHTVFITGDSISTAVAPGLIAYGKTHGWRVIIMSMERCPFGTQVPYDGAAKYENCIQYRKAILDEVARVKPDLFVVANSYLSNSMLETPDGQVTSSPSETSRLAVAGILEQTKALQAEGIRVALVSPPKANAMPVLDCLFAKGTTASCHFPPDGDRDFMRDVYELNSEVLYLDLASTYCAEDCFPMVNDLLVYRDTVHFTIQFSETILAPLLGETLESVEREE